MDAVSAAASVIAIIELSAKITSLCLSYSKAVKSAKADIKRLQDEVQRLEAVSKGAQKLLSGPDGAKLEVSSQVSGTLQDCLEELRGLVTTLDQKLDSKRKAMHSFGIRSLKWPLESKDSNRIMEKLGRHQQTLQTAFLVDHIKLTQGIERTIQNVEKNTHGIEEAAQKILQALKLPEASGAAFDSFEDQLDSRCHPKTRVKLLEEIRTWATDPRGERIFWLNGMAGTGKSTISRTIAQGFSDEGRLGASFFFKRGESDRNNASNLFSTIAAQLARTLPSMGFLIKNMIDSDASICTKNLKDQLEKLILKPLSQVQGLRDPTILVIVLDALDECDNEDHIRLILSHLAQAQTAGPVDLRFFITSRPELPTLFGFRDMPAGIHQDLVLHEIPQIVIESDINAFMEAEFAKIRSSYNTMYPSGQHLPSDWPGEEPRKALTSMASPLFIFAATVCRFIGETRMDPVDRLKIVLDFKTSSQADKLDMTYQPILDSSLRGLTNSEQREYTREFEEIIGPVVLLAEPLSIVTLANLLRISRNAIDRKVAALHSVLNVSSEESSPIRLLHLSFRDFLTDPEKRDRNGFWVDQQAVHKKLVEKCIALMSQENGLKRDICRLGRPGALTRDISNDDVQAFISAELQYAARHWVYHLDQSHSPFDYEDRVLFFLKKHFLHWLEAGSLLSRTNEFLQEIVTLQSVFNTKTRGSALADFLNDAKRFVQANISLITEAPLQLYYSGLIFAPKTSVVRMNFIEDLPSWLKRPPQVPNTWGAMLQVIDSNDDNVKVLTFSPDGKHLASGYGETIRLWSLSTGLLSQELSTPSLSFYAFPTYDMPQSLCFSSDSKYIASCFGRRVILWDLTTSKQRHELSTNSVCNFSSIAFSKDGARLFFASLDRMLIWDTSSGAVEKHLTHNSRTTSAAFSPDGKLVALTQAGLSSPWPSLVTPISQMSQALSDGNSMKSILSQKSSILSTCGVAMPMSRTPWTSTDSVQVRGLTFSSNHGSRALVGRQQLISIYDTATGSPLIFLPIESGGVLGGQASQMALSSDSKFMAFALVEEIVIIDVLAGTCVQRITWPSRSTLVSTVLSLSADGSRLVHSLQNEGIRVWDLEKGVFCHTGDFRGHSSIMKRIAISPNNEYIASCSNREVVLWDTALPDLLNISECHEKLVKYIRFSEDGKRMLSISGEPNLDVGEITLWDVTEEPVLLHRSGEKGYIRGAKFSLDGQYLAYPYGEDKKWFHEDEEEEFGEFVEVLDATGIQICRLKCSTRCECLALSSDGKWLAIGLLGVNSMVVEIKDVMKEDLIQTLESIEIEDIATFLPKDIAFSTDASLLAVLFTHQKRVIGLSANTSPLEKVINLWDTDTGALRSVFKIELFSPESIHFKGNDRLFVNDRFFLNGFGDQVLIEVKDAQMLLHPGRIPQDRSSDNLIGLYDDWIEYDQERLIWLPLAYRESIGYSSLDIRDQILAIGHDSGRISFFKFDFQELSKEQERWHDMEEERWPGLERNCM